MPHEDTTVNAALRVASVLPSATEILCFIGGSKLLVARSHEDNYPKEITHLPIITGQKTTFTTSGDVDKQVSIALTTGQSLYTLDTEQLSAARPDVILTQDICSVCAIDLPTVQRIAAEMSPSPKVVSLDPLNIEDVLYNLTQLGKELGMQEQAAAALARLRSRIAKVDDCVAAWKTKPENALLEVPNVAFIEWPDPLYVGGHWTPQLIERAGGRHPLNPSKGSDGGGKSFAVPASKLIESDPDLIIICPCGLDLAATRQEAATFQELEWWNSLRAVKAGRVALVDGDAMFNRPGPRLIDALEWLCATLLDQKDMMPADFPVEWLDPCPAEHKVAQGANKRERDLGDIEELHRMTVEKGEKHYTDPATGYCVFTQLFMLERGWCCGSGCRHCPYGHKNVADPARKKKLPLPITVAGTGCPHKSKPRPLG